MLSRVADRLANDLLVPQVDAVKETNSQADPAPHRCQLGGAMNDFHRATMLVAGVPGIGFSSGLGSR
jgi:hypothetical protein